MADIYYPGIAAGDAASVGEDGTVSAVVTPNSTYQVFELTDSTYSNPLTIKTPSGLTRTDVPVGALPVFPDVYVVSENFAHLWKSGDLKFRRDSADAKDKAVADALAAVQLAAINAGAAAEAEIAQRIEAGEFNGLPGKDGANVATTRDAVAAELEDPASPSRTVLSATILEVGNTAFAEAITVAATADGATGQSAKIQAALDRARDAGGGTVIVPPRAKEYALDRTLYIADNVTLWAYGAKFKALPGCGHTLRAEGDRRSVWAPKGPAAVARTTGGTLAAGAYAYRVTAQTANGETIPTIEVTATTTGTTGSVLISWAAPRSRTGQPAITGYRVYGRTSGAIGTLLGQTTALNFVDTGMAGTAQAFPLINPTVARTRNASVFGGMYDQAMITSNGLAIEGEYYGNCFDLVKVDNLTLRDIKILNAPKWAVAVCDFNNLITDNLDFDTHSDGIHVIGPGNIWNARNVSGTVGDDMIGISAMEWPIEARSQGNVDNVHVENVHVEGGFSGCRMLGGIGVELGSITLKNFTGTCTGNAPGIYVNNNMFGTGRIGTTIRKLIIDGVSLATVSLTYPMVEVSAMVCDNVEISNLVVPSTGRRGVKFGGGGFTKRARVSNISVKGGLTGVDLVYIEAGNIKRLEVDGAYTHDPATAALLLNVVSSSVIDRLVLSNLHQESTADAVSVAGTANIGSASVSACFMKAGTANSLVYLQSGTAPLWQFTNILGAAFQSLLKTKIPTEAHLSNIVGSPSAGLVAAYDATASAVIKGSNVSLPSGTGASRSLQQTLRSTSLDFPVDVWALARVDGDACYNTNPARSCGTGPVVCNGATWKHIYTGATY